LFTTYSVKAGDTLESIARKSYGNGANSQLIFKANPGLSETLMPGTSIVLPRLLDTPFKLPTVTSSPGQHDVTIFINNKMFRFFSELEITRSVDSIDSFQFLCPFDSDAFNYRDVLAPMSYSNIVIYIGNELMLTGFVLDASPTESSDSVINSVSGYASPGILNDCMPSIHDLSFNFNDVTLQGISNKLLQPFGIDSVFKASSGSVFNVTVDPTDGILRFLVKLSHQRNLVINSTESGQLRFWQSISSGTPVAILNEGDASFTNIDVSFNPQHYYSHITGLSPEGSIYSASKHTIKNPFLTHIFRPFVFRVPDNDNSTLKAAVKAKVGRMFANVARYTVDVPTWFDASGKLWEPNTIIQLFAPNAKVYKSYNFILRSVTFTATATAQTAKLQLMLPGSFNGTIPESLPWLL